MQDQVLVSNRSPLSIRISDLGQLTKVRLGSLVVFSAAMAYLSAPGPVYWPGFVWLIIGGFLTTAAANGFNQVMERDLDKLMDRTQNRPLPAGRMSSSQALWICALTGTVGVLILSVYNNVASGLLGLLSIVLYTIAYTPMKRRSPLAVFVGAIPGAIPPLLGWVAATGSMSLFGWILFAIQFMWQFPHFWAIAWVLDEDYKKAGFRMLPSGERNKDSAMQALLYTFSLLPIGCMPYLIGLSGWISFLLISAVSLYFLWLAFRLFMTCEMSDARKLMYGSFLYLPVVQIALVIDKL
jgi:protoheme IX farnesyltransferase